MRFVIYGCGTRGKMLLACLEQVEAFIESDFRQIGTSFNGVRIILIKEYMQNYQDCFVIVSPILFHDEIVDILQQNHIQQYFSLLRCPNELPGYEAPLPFHEMLSGISPIDNTQPIVLIGVNLFSILLYDYLQNQIIDKVFFADLPEQEQIINEIRRREPSYHFISIKQALTRNARFLMTDRYIEKRRTEKLTNSEQFYRFHALTCYQHRDMSQFKNIHKGARCFIVGNGPSLRIEDLEILYEHGELSFGVNQVYKAFTLTHWRPNYYCAADLYVVKTFANQIHNLSGMYKFIGNRCASVLQGIHDEKLFFFPLLFEYYEEEGPDFSSNPNEGIFSGCTVIYDCLQFAVYMGFKELYLIGTDCNYQNQGGAGDYFIKDYNDSKIHPSNFLADKVFIAYRKAREYAETHGIKIYNATRGGKLEVFERVDFDSLF